MRLGIARILILTSACSMAGCGGGGAADGPPAPPAYDLYVDALAGSDLNPGTEAQPLKTLTAALAAVQNGGSVKVAPGTYDAANGEAFPLQVPLGVSVEGDVANRGDGPVATLVSGAAPIAPGSGEHAALLPADGASVRGLKIEAGSVAASRYGVRIESATVELADCTLTAQSYASVLLLGSGASDLHDCALAGDSYGLWLSAPTGAVTVHDNVFTAGFYAARVDGGNQCQFTDNVIAAGANQGLQLINSNARVEGNAFTHAGHASAAVWVHSGTPVLRGNTFTSNLGVRIASAGTPDLGLPADPGLNGFAGVTGFALTHEGAATVQAQGNTWQHLPPTAGLDIVVTGAGTVVYGPGANDKVP